MDALFLIQRNGADALFRGNFYSGIPDVPDNPVDNQPPSMFGTLSASNVNAQGFTISWTAGADNVGVVSYEVSQNNGATYQDIGKVLSYVFNNMASETTYTIRVRAKDAVGLVSPPLTTQVTTSSVPRVNGVSVSPATAIIQGGGKMKFTASVDGPNNPSQEVDWEVTLGTIDATGTVTAPAGTGVVQSGVVKAISRAFPDKFGTAVFTVPMLVITTPEPTDPDVADIIVAPSRILRTAANDWKERIDYTEKDGDTFYLSQGLWCIDKDPDDKLYYALDLIPYLESIGAGVNSVIGLVQGVELLRGPFVRDRLIIVKIGGGDSSSSMDSVNSLTLRVSCSNGEVLDRTIYFVMKDN